MGELFNRDFVLNLGGTRVASKTTDGARNEILKVVFSIERSLSAAANNADISVWNLAEQTRGLVSEQAIETRLEVGYSGKSSVIFQGKLEAGVSTKDGTDWVTTFQATDGGKELREARMNISFEPGVSATEAFDRVVDSLGVGLGNAKEQFKKGNIRGALKAFGNGLVMSGTSKGQLDKLTKMYGYDWSIQKGQLQLLGPTDAIDATNAVVLNSDSGMIGTPQAGENGVVEVRSLLIPELEPGRVVNVQGLQIKGFFRIERVLFTGDTRGQDWYADLELKPR